MTFERIDDRAINYVSVHLNTELGCNPLQGEFSLYISDFIGTIDIDSGGSVDDISLIKDCIANELDFKKLPPEGCTEIVLKESGEWEDVFWHKYYVIERICILT